MHLTTQQRVFAAKTYYKTSSYLEEKEAFRRFLEKDPPPSTNRTIWKNVKKSEREGACLNIKKGKSGRRRTVRTEETIKVVRFYIENNARKVSCRHNELGLSRNTSNKIMKQDLK